VADEPKEPSSEKPAAPAHAAPPKPAGMTATPWESELTAELKDAFGDAIREFSCYLGQEFLVARPEALIDILDHLKLECEFDYLVDLTAVDWPEKPERFELVYILYSFARNQRIRVKTHVGEGARPQTAVGVYLAANWMEREVYDMFGIEFEGHPDMKRLLLPEEWQGHPLRKDYGILQMDNRWVQENMGIESGQ
jgi:NADH-quinone oxidoreductase subunit C